MRKPFDSASDDDQFVWSDVTPVWAYDWSDITPASAGTVLAVEKDPFPPSSRRCDSCGRMHGLVAADASEGNVVAAVGDDGPDSKRAA